MTATKGQQPETASQHSSLERVYIILSGDDHYDRACAAIPDSECSALPKNYVMNVLNGAATMPMVGCLLTFGLARGVGSVAFQDATGKTIPKGKRWKMLAARGIIGALLTIAVGLALKGLLGTSAGIQPVLMVG